MLINIHSHHLSTAENSIITIYNQYPWDFQFNNSYYSIGIHPIFIDQSSINKDLKFIEQKLSDPKCLAIGEIGLDKLTTVDFNLQIEVFKAQLLIAEANKTPVIIHCVRAYQEIFKIRKDLNITIPFIFHGFNKNENLLQQILANNCIPSFGKKLLQNQNLQTIFANLSENNFFLETDDCQVSIEEIYQKAAEIRNTKFEILEQHILDNFNRIFKQSFI